jgi:putative tryptophan/tyrosine transport system substrate-binding protein
LKRREFMSLLAAAAIARSIGVRAEQSMPVIGLLSVFSPAEAEFLVAAFRQGLEESGYVEGRNIAIEYRWAETQYDRLPGLVADLVGHHVSVIAATGGGVSARAAKAATATIPIVFVAGDLDPVASGLVKSLNRPGGNITGIAPATSFLGPKRLELLHDLLPQAAVVGMLVNPNFADAETQVSEAQDAALKLGLRLNVLNAGKDADFEPALSTFSKQHTEALLVANDAMFNSRRAQLTALVARYGIPAIYSYREYVVAGGLISYAPSLTDSYRQAGVYAGKILNGAEPADLPVVQPAKFEMVINLKSAKAMGLEVPPMLLDRADEVIE